MKYLITGGSGYIGSRLTDLLVENDDNEVREPRHQAAGRATLADALPARWTSATAGCATCSSASAPTP